MAKFNLITVACLPLISAAFAADSVCNNPPYKDALFISRYGPAQAYCTSVFPVPPVTTTVTAPAMTKRGQNCKRQTSPTTTAQSACTGDCASWSSYKMQGTRFISTLCSCIEHPKTVTVTVTGTKPATTTATTTTKVTTTMTTSTATKTTTGSTTTTSASCANIGSRQFRIRSSDNLYVAAVNNRQAVQLVTQNNRDDGLFYLDGSRLIPVNLSFTTFAAIRNNAETAPDAIHSYDETNKSVFNATDISCAVAPDCSLTFSLGTANGIYDGSTLLYLGPANYNNPSYTRVTLKILPQ